MVSKNFIWELFQTKSEEKIISYLGYEKHNESPNPNYWNRHNKKSLKTKYIKIDISIPCNRDASFEAKLILKRKRFLKESEDLILFLHTKGISVRDIQHHLNDLYGCELSEW